MRRVGADKLAPRYLFSLRILIVPGIVTAAADRVSFVYSGK